MHEASVERVARRLNAKRREMIAQPLSSCWDDLAQEAIAECMAILGEPTQQMRAAAQGWSSERTIFREMLAASLLSQGGQE